MGGLRHIFYRITPIITLICFICYGIIHFFPEQNNISPITYLETTYINKTTGEEYNNPTQEEIQESYKMYTFDMVEYVNNIDQDILKRSVSKTFNIQAFPNTINAFNHIWENGYQFGDVTRTILNALIIVIDAIILPVNILLIPIRVISGILLTGLSIIGININNGRIICPFLTILVDELSIPLLIPTWARTDKTELNNSEWTFNTIPDRKYYKRQPSVVTGQIINHYTDFNIDIGFHTSHRLPNQMSTPCSAIKTAYKDETGYNFRIYYKVQGQWREVYNENTGWTDDDYRTIWFYDNATENLDNIKVNELLLLLQSNAIYEGQYVEP